MLDAFKPHYKINLLIPWFNHEDTNSLRYQEIHTCLENNLQNNKINKIIFFYEIDDVKNINYDLYNNPKIKIIPVIYRTIHGAANFHMRSQRTLLIKPQRLLLN